MKNLKKKILSITLMLFLGASYFGIEYIKADNDIEKPIAKKESITYDKMVAEKKQRRENGYSKAEAPEKFAEIERQKRTPIGKNSPEYGPNQILEEYYKAKNNAQTARTESDIEFIERGPANVAGRTRGLIVDFDDPTNQTWFAGSASGGIWKTVDAGANWEYISSDIPNLGTNTLAMSPANPDVIYAGTGEHFTTDIDGSGMFKSTDKGNSWVQIANPADFPDFKNISRIIVDPNDENIVVATTRSSVWGSLSAAIYKTIDGGQNWTRFRTSTTERYDDIDYEPGNFNVQYVAVQGRGVLKSTNAGETWQNTSSGLIASGRIEITVSPLNTQRIWASVQGSLSGNGSDLYVSSDGAQTWKLVLKGSGANEDFLGGQGWYDNIITAHPFDANTVYVGGVNTFKFTLGNDLSTQNKVLQLNSEEVTSFIALINFSAAHAGGTLATSFDSSNWKNVEVRFGQGTQKAHRFTVGFQGPGVPAQNYIYKDYVDVPFQVWDVDNNKQLMVSFRDQQEDGKWNLILQNTAGDGSLHSREYVHIHNFEYSDNPIDTLAKNGGHQVAQLYFFWPVLSAGGTFNSTDLPNSTLKINAINIQAIERQTTVISDAYNQFSGPNLFPQQTRTIGLHPDQHNIHTIITNSTDKTFRLLIANDGGVYLSKSTTNPGAVNGDFTYVSYGYNTTQFYGADKAPGEERYFGGMQDNGSWYIDQGGIGSENALFKFAIGGDGFEVLWNSLDGLKMIGGSQNNNFAKTINGGQSWFVAKTGYDDEGPFITRLANSNDSPDRIFTVGSKGVWKSNNFGDLWTLSPISNEFWGFHSSYDVEVSSANPDIIWAGGRLQTSERLFVSTNGGSSFSAVQNYTQFNMGFCSGFGTHPSKPNTAYALFSFAGFPKVLKTTDLGLTWNDLSGFDGSGSRGFPDVAVNTILVFPNDTARIWVGTEIGIVESRNSGETWNLLEGEMPPVNVYNLRVSDDQIVIATYGRGIWSAKIPNFILPPSIQSSYVNIEGQVKLEINFAADYDSTQIYIGSQLVTTFYNNQSGLNDLFIDDFPTNGLNKIRADSYLGGNKYSSFEKDVFLFELRESTSSYATNFSSGTSIDFANKGFQIFNDLRIGGNALQTPHPYADNIEYLSYLKNPVIVNSSNAFIIYDDIALIEPGEPGSTYPSEAFYDYVVFEASNDGKNWIALEPGYDARLHQVWRTAYDNNTNPSVSLYKRHNINLLNFFEPGEELIFRFRLFSDPAVNGYGWTIKNLYIQSDPLSTETKEKMVVAIFPNPVSSVINIESNTYKVNRVKLIAIDGKIAKETVVNNNTFQWNIEGLKPGIYVLQVFSDGGTEKRKIVIQD